jgi:hypothetical protein
MERWRTTAEKGRSWVSQHLLVLLGAAAIMPLVAIDPAAVVLLFDVEFLVMTASAGLAMLRGDGRVLLDHCANSLTVLALRAGAAMTREDPRSLLA